MAAPRTGWGSDIYYLLLGASYQSGPRALSPKLKDGGEAAVEEYPACMYRNFKADCRINFGIDGTATRRSNFRGLGTEMQVELFRDDKQAAIEATKTEKLRLLSNVTSILIIIRHQFDCARSVPDS